MNSQQFTLQKNQLTSHIDIDNIMKFNKTTIQIGVLQALPLRLVWRILQFFNQGQLENISQIVDTAININSSTKTKNKLNLLPFKKLLETKITFMQFIANEHADRSYYYQLFNYDYYSKNNKDNKIDNNYGVSYWKYQMDTVFKMAVSHPVGPKHITLLAQQFHEQVRKCSKMIQNMCNRFPQQQPSVELSHFNKLKVEQETSPTINQSQIRSEKYSIKQIQNCINEIFLHPPIPLPKMFRETMPIESCSNLQNLIIQLQIQNKQGYGSVPYYKIIKHLRTQVEKQDEGYLKNMLHHFGKTIKLFRQSQLLNKHNAHKYMIEQEAKIIQNLMAQENVCQSSLHNLLVQILLLTKTQIMLSQSYLAHQYSITGDKFQLMLQLVLRYTLFCNTVTAIQQNFGPIFHTFANMVSEITDNVDTAHFRYWRTAYAMWIMHMQDLHSITNQCFSQLLQFQAHEHMKQQIGKSFNTFGPSNAQLKYLNQSPLFSMFYNRQQQISDQYHNQLGILLNSYQQYMTDIQTDEISVYGFSHSQWKAGESYQQFQQSVLSLQKQFITILAQRINIYEDDCSSNIKSNADMIKQRIRWFNQILKPSTIKKIINIYTENRKNNSQNEKLLPSSLKMIVEKQLAQFIKLMDKKDKQIENYLEYLVRNGIIRYKVVEKIPSANNNNTNGYNSSRYRFKMQNYPVPSPYKMAQAGLLKIKNGKNKQRTQKQMNQMEECKYQMQQWQFQSQSQSQSQSQAQSPQIEQLSGTLGDQIDIEKEELRDFKFYESDEQENEQVPHPQQCKQFSRMQAE